MPLAPSAVQVLVGALGVQVAWCFLELSYALNKSGARIRPTAGVHLYKGAPQIIPSTTRHARPSTVSEQYVFRLADMKTHLVSRYGKGTLIYDGHDRTDFNASGHVDLFRVVLGDGRPPTLIPGCVGHCYWMPGPMLAYLWELRP